MQIDAVLSSRTISCIHLVHQHTYRDTEIRPARRGRASRFVCPGLIKIKAGGMTVMESRRWVRIMDGTLPTSIMRCPMCSIPKAIAVLMATSVLYAGLASAQSTSTMQSKPAATTAPVPVAGKATLGVAVVEMDAVIAGWSVQKDILKKTVYNDKKEKIGTISDIVISPNPDVKLPSASFAIVGVGGFLGMGKHDVVIPLEQIKLQDNNLVLAGATKDSLKALPKFEYRRK